MLDKPANADATQLNNDKSQAQDEIQAKSVLAPVDAGASVSTSSDGMSAKIILTEPENGGKRVTKATIASALEAKGITSGIKTEYIERLSKHPVYERKFIIATGLLPQDGIDEQLQCHFDTDMTLVPRVLDDGSTDYKNLGFGRPVEEGDVVAEILPAVPGVDGYDVFGKKKEGKPGVTLTPSPIGSNVALSEDGTKLVAACGGNASLQDKKVHVRKEMTVTHVDQSTGNIIFAGDVCVKGDVRDGFTVRAGGSINVGGVVENAVLVAGRDIVIKTGMHGENSSITAGGAIKTVYIEMGTIKAKECVYADVVLNADIVSEDKVILTGKKACFIGGSCRVTNYFEAKTIGNEANVATKIEIIEPKFIDPIREDLTARIKDCGERITLLNDAWRSTTTSNMPTVEKKEKAAQLLNAKKDSEALLKELTAELAQMPNIADEESKSSMLVHEHIYPNVSINFDGFQLKNTIIRPGCKVTRKKDKIVFGTHS